MQAGLRDYQELSFSRNALKRLYALTLTLTLLLALAAALGLAVVLSERFAAPLGLLAEGTRAVAQGDFTRRQPVVSRDELGVLTESFNTMTAQLAEAQGQGRGERGSAIETTRAYLESILGNLSAGVLAFDERLSAAHGQPERGGDPAAAARRPDRHAAGRLGRRLPALAPFAELVADGFRGSRDGQWQKEAQLAVAQPVAHAADARHAPARERRCRATWWSSTTCPSWCRRSATPRGPKSRGGSRTRSRTR